MILFVLFILLIVGVIVWVTWKLTDIAANRPSKTVKPTQEPQAKPKRKVYRTVRTIMIYPDDQERAEDFMRCYKPNKTDWYTLTKKELIEDHNGEKVYKYYPANVPHKFEDNEVLSKLKGEWVRIGTVTEEEKQEIIDNHGMLTLFGGTYKEVYDDVEIIEDDPFFGFKVQKLE